MAKRKINPRVDHEGIPRCKSSCKWWKDGISCTHEDAVPAQPMINTVCWPALLRLLGQISCLSERREMYRGRISGSTEIKESKR